MKQLFIFILIFNLLSCKVRKSNITCDYDNALLTANNFFKKEGYIIDYYDCKVIDKKDMFIIKYILNKENMRGGGAELKISKTNCEIIDKVLYQ